MEDAPQALPKKEVELLREPVGVPAGDPAAPRHTQPNTCPEGDCQGFFTVFHAAFARGWSSDAPRGCRAWRETDASDGVRACPHRARRRSPGHARARPAACWAWPVSRCGWEDPWAQQAWRLAEIGRAHV